MSKLIITENVSLDDLDQFEYLVADASDEQYVSIDGPAEMSSSLPGLYSVETSIGMVYLDPEFTVRAACLK